MLEQISFMDIKLVLWELGITQGDPPSNPLEYLCGHQLPGLNPMNMQGTISERRAAGTILSGSVSIRLHSMCAWRRPWRGPVTASSRLLSTHSLPLLCVKLITILCVCMC